ncbi:MAG: ATP phosphoribosyltransferase, partial [Chloroflexi bacterium]|nr:ATP phosphoribosyltransferase [Chloroflexota bacterium]
VLGPLMDGASAAGRAGGLRLPAPLPAGGRRAAPAPERSGVRLALPDGHQQPNAVAALRAAGLALDGYDESRCVRRPASSLAGLEVKVIRPHDMPQLVATGEMDLAVTGRDCLMNHLYRFPSSPVAEIADLRRGQFNLSAVVSEELPANSIAEALDGWRSENKALLRVAAELPDVADYYARSRHFWRYRVIPIAGASEGFVPEDADLLIEGTETGKTLVENRLKAIDLLFRSTTCVIARKDVARHGRRRRVFDEVVAALRRSVQTAETV